MIRRAEMRRNIQQILEYQAKLDMIEPSAYGDARGLSLEEGAYISIIGKGTNDDFWVQVKKGAEQAGKDINEQLGYKGKKAVKVVYSGPSDKDNVDEQVIPLSGSFGNFYCRRQSMRSAVRSSRLEWNTNCNI